MTRPRTVIAGPGGGKTNTIPKNFLRGFTNMAKKKGSSAFFQAEKFSQSLGGLIDALPSESDRQQVVSQLQILIQFLTTLKTRLETIPTQQDAGAARTAIDKLASLFAEARSNPIIGAAVGIRSTARRSKPPAITSEDIDRAKSAIARFQSLPIYQIRSALDRMSVRDLQAVAKAMGIRTGQRTT